MPDDTASPDLDAFIERWKRSAAAETANFQSFIHDLCDLLDVPRPDPTTKVATADKLRWPSENVRQVESVHAILRSAPGPLDVAGVAAHFRRGQMKRIEEILSASATLGYAHREEGGWVWG